ncbi:MAG: ADOP family duplicated permease [Terriglobales bacterium]
MWYRSRRRPRHQMAREMAEEMAEHLARRAEALEAEGLAPAEARRRAAIEFGSLPRHQEAGREAWGGAAWDAVRRDAGYALRQMRRNPGFAAAIIVTLALAVGANTALFSTLYAVLLRPLPYPHPERLVTIDNSISLPQFRALQAKACAAFQAFAVEGWSDFTLQGRGAPLDLPAERVTPAFFRVFGVPATLGHVFTRADLNAGRRHQVVLSYGLWRQVFGGSRRIVGQVIDLSGRDYRVAAVMPPGFLAAEAIHDRLWAPLPMKPRLRSNDWAWLISVGRLRAGVSLAQARAVVATARRSMVAGGHNRYLPPLPLLSYARQVSMGFRQPLWLLVTASELILLIACLNIAGLLLARNTGRQAEMAMRAALGARRRVLMRQLMIESAVLATIGCGLGLLLGTWMLAALRLAAIAAGMPRVHGAVMGGVTLAFAAILLVATLVLFGLLPAWEASRVDLHSAARPGLPPRRQRRLREILVAAELALAVALAFGAGLLLRSYASLTSLPLGFNPHHLLTLSTRVPPGPPHESAAHLQAREDIFANAAVRRLDALPGVRAASVAGYAPFGGLQVGFANPPGRRRGAETLFNQVGPGYWQALGAPLLAGRAFDAADRPGARPVVIVSQTLARQLWPGQSPLGRQLTQAGGPKKPFTVVGEVANTMQFGPIGDSAVGFNMLAQPALYIPFGQSGASGFSFLLRTRVAPASLEPAVRKVFRQLNPTEPVTGMLTMDQQLASLLASHRLYLALLLALAVLALALVVAGVYGVTQFAAAARTGEMGIRKALGAEEAEVLRLILGRSAAVALAGAVTGAGLGLVLARLLTGLLYGVKPADPLTLAATAALGLAVGLAAAYGPARRAARLEPMAALRCE